MPRYDFKCERCGSTNELLIDMNSIKKNPVVPSCCDAKMKRVFSPPQRVWKDGQAPK